MRAPTFDLLVVGAGPAGAATALAALATDPTARVALVDRATFPRDKFCGDGLTPSAVAILGELGVGHVLDGFAPVEQLEVTAPDSVGDPRKEWQAQRMRIEEWWPKFDPATRSECGRRGNCLQLDVIALGAILKFAVMGSVSGISLAVGGVVLMVVRIVGFVPSMVMANTALPTDVLHHSWLVQQRGVGARGLRGAAAS